MIPITKKKVRNNLCRTCISPTIVWKGLVISLLSFSCRSDDGRAAKQRVMQRSEQLGKDESENENDRGETWVSVKVV